MKNQYTAWAYNKNGGRLEVGDGSNKNELIATARRKLGSGWVVVIEKIQRDSGIMFFDPLEVKRFTIR